MDQQNSKRSGCPFYGKSGIANFMLVDTYGNQCGLIVTAHAPCAMEMERLAPNAHECPLIVIMRDGGPVGEFHYQAALIAEFLDHPGPAN
jgi:hypothetical protein